MQIHGYRILHQPDNLIEARNARTNNKKKEVEERQPHKEEKHETGDQTSTPRVSSSKEGRQPASQSPAKSPGFSISPTRSVCPVDTFEPPCIPPVDLSVPLAVFSKRGAEEGGLRSVHPSASRSVLEVTRGVVFCPPRASSVT